MGNEPSNSSSLHAPITDSPPSLPPVTRLLAPEAFSPRIQQCRQQFLDEDGRFTDEQILNISGSTDGFDECSLHVVSGERGFETAVMRVTVVHPLDSDIGPSLPFQHFYPSYTQPLQPGDAEISRFLVSPGARKGRSTSGLIEAAFRLCVTENVKRLFIDVVDGDLGIAPKSYEKHFGFKFTGDKGYDSNYSCNTYLMVLEGADKIREVAERLTARLSRV